MIWNDVFTNDVANYYSELTDLVVMGKRQPSGVYALQRLPCRLWDRLLVR